MSANWKRIPRKLKKRTNHGWLTRFLCDRRAQRAAAWMLWRKEPQP